MSPTTAHQAARSCTATRTLHGDHRAPPTGTFRRGLVRGTCGLVIFAAGATIASSISNEPPSSRFEALPDARVANRWTFDHAGDREGWRAGKGVESLAVADGALRIRVNGPDAHVIGPTIHVDSGKHQFLGLRCRANVAGTTQIYFGDVEAPAFIDGRFVAIEMQPSDQFVTYEVDLREVQGWSGIVDELRLDPVNGLEEVGAEFELDWLAVYQAPPRLVPILPHWVGDDALAVGFENHGGWDIDSPIEFVSDGVVLGSIDELERDATRGTELELDHLPHWAWIEAVHEGRAIWRARVVRPSGPPDASIALAHRPAISIQGGVGVLTDGSERSVRLSPIASLTVRAPDGVPTYYEFDVKRAPGSDDAAPYTETIDDPRVGAVTCTLRVDGTRVEASVESCADLEILRFEGPRLLEERPHSHAILPGLEYLEAGETSSNPAWTGTVHGRRVRPPAYRITAPAMYLEYDRVDGVRGDDPAQAAWVASIAWADFGTAQLEHDRAPAAEFRSSNDEPSWASVFLPAREFADVRDDVYAAEPQRLSAGNVLSLRTSFAIERGTIEDVFARHWMSRIPDPPSLGFVAPAERAEGADRPAAGDAHALETILATSMDAYTRTLYDGKGLWKTHIAVQEPYSDRVDMAAAIVAESERSGHREYAETVGLGPDASIETLLGSAAAWVGPRMYAKAAQAIAAMAPDGSIGYAVTPAMSEKIAAMATFHGAQGDALGERGATNAGLIAEKALPLLEYAACTRDPIFVAAAMRALERMNSFTVPRGSQTWEIHADTPDLYAAALCARADLWGWRLTGDERYLDEAQRWIRTGLPFLYWWEPAGRADVRAVHVADENGEGPVLAERDPSPFYADADRDILPFASIPVFGTSWYAVPWFGIPVQWCGLAWSNAVREIDAVRPMPDYVRVADGIFRSAANQQCDQGYLAGTLPDSWDLASDTSRQPFIVPERLVEYAYRCLGAPNVGGREYVRLEGGEWTHVASRSVLEHVEQLRGRLSISSRFFAGQDASLILGGTRQPLRAVRVDGIELAQGAGVGQYHWIECGADRAVLVVRWRSKSTDRIDIEIETES